MIGQLPGVTAVQYTGTVSSASAYRSPLIPADRHQRAERGTPPAWACPPRSGTSVAQGSYLNAATAREPVAVLGARGRPAAGHRPDLARRADLGRRPVVLPRPGILNPATLAPQIDTSVLVGFPAAEQYLGFDGHPSEHLRPHRQHPGRHHRVDNLLAAQANPENPERGQRLPAVGTP